MQEKRREAGRAAQGMEEMMEKGHGKGEFWE